MKLSESIDAMPARTPNARTVVLGGRIVPLAEISGSGSEISERQKAIFRRDGFLLIENVSMPAELASLRVVYDRLFSERRGWETGDLFDMVGTDNLHTSLALPQLLWPSRYDSALRQTLLHSNAVSIATQLLGPKAQNVLEHAIMKPPQVGAETPWHQDDAFIRRGSGCVEQISIWFPLQDVKVENGCLLYIRGSNHGPLMTHRSAQNDPRIHGLETTKPPDLTHCVAVEMSAGSAVIHHSRTLHSAGVNTSLEPRRAYILGYSVQTQRHRLLLPDFPWNLEKRTARARRELQSLHPLKRTLLRFRRLLRGQTF